MAEGGGGPHLTYRPEIDGLRAVAVVAVVLFHFGIRPLGGGFVGVDVFFVISGFLIGSLLWREHVATGRVSLRAFYLRRFRRLAPAWTAMGLGVFAVGYLVLLPNDLRELGKSLVAAALFAANIHFYRGAGYFDLEAEEKPLLHMWSLSLEEQFYLVLPLVMLALAGRWRPALAPLLAGAAALSLVACILLTPGHQTATFFLFPFRAWELLAGVLLAIGVETRRLPARLGLPVSLAGIGLVLASVVLIRPGAGFPGYAAIMPVAGTLLLILNGRDENAVNRALSLRPVVWVGAISYSLYLWHWPVRSFAQFLLDAPPGPLASLGLIALSVALAWLSWRFVERPFRRPRSDNRPFMAGVAATAALLVGLGLWPYLAAGLPGRWSGEVLAYADAAEDFIQDWSRCTTPATGAFAGIEVCALGPEGPPRVLAWGDSHLRAMKEGLDLAATEAGVPALLVWRAGCPPLFGIEKRETAATRQQDADCTSHNRQMEAAIAASDIDTVLLVGRWSYYAEGGGTGIDAHNRITLSDTLAGDRGDPWTDGVARTLCSLAEGGRRVFVLRQVPEIAEYDSQRAARRLARGEPLPAGVTIIARGTAEAREARGLAPFARAAAEGQVALLDSWPMLCDAALCRATRGDQPLYFDNNHLTNTGARALRSLFAPVWRGLD